ncbi:glycosyltransferase family 4 protein [Simiduia agarivorans]|uniref:Glycosyltransferase n=1 Tax=Simiduia agarivorans (strain DSM 21679 / JCM 13881 / BCRC 17597 / SA1) TaxID=1117647 RepID=R9S3B6_SIMAS|nr:glycosyltransferase family 4 protein [Simiduia agarivorans]AGN11312.1 glycosyltransferase [Simiduia agarivorans SA1 = DSM 21679]
MANRKLIWVSHFIPYPPKGGALQRSYNLLKELSNHFDIDLICIRSDRLVRDNFGDLNRGLDVCQEQLSKLAADVKFIAADRSVTNTLQKYIAAAGAFFSLSPFIEYWVKSSAIQSIIAEKLVENPDAIVHLDSIGMCYSVAGLPANTVIINHHNIESDMQYRRAREESNFFKKIYFLLDAYKIRRLEAKYCSAASLNVYCSDLDRERMKSNLGVGGVVAPNGVDVNYFRSKSVDISMRKGLIFAGGIGWYPNYSAMKFFLLEVWPKLSLLLPDLTLTIVGRDGEKLRKYVSSEKVTITGFVDDVRCYIDSAAVYVCPIFVGGGTKLKVLDALSMGIPMVAHPIACEGIDVVDGESVVCASGADEFVEATVDLLSNQDKRSRLAARGRELVECQYSFCAIGAKLAQDYWEISQ